MFDIKFWGVRGSVPAPLTPAQVEKKIQYAFAHGKNGAEWEQLPFVDRSTFGGNTTCVEVNCGTRQFILDMGTGVRELGKQMLHTAFQQKKLHGTILQSHVHWDHIQGFPFWGPLYLPRSKFDCRFEFYGGKQWDSKLDAVYRGQMDAPYFPVNLEELEASAMHMQFNTIWDEWNHYWFSHNDDNGRPLMIKALARKLFHPQETFGYRIEFDGKAIAFTTDHEPYAAGVPRGLLELVNNVDVWITDCQYSHSEYIGVDGVQKMGWGHSFPEYVATVARSTNPKLIITTHHDPDANDDRIVVLAQVVEQLSHVETRPAYEGLVVSV